MDDVDVDIARRVLVELFRPSKIDDPGDAVRGERTPAVIGQEPDVVRAHERAVPRLTAVFERDAAEVPDVQAPSHSR